VATPIARHERASFGDPAEPVVRNTIVNTVLSTPVDEQNHKHPPSSPGPVSRVRTVSLADRAALHLGIALITWSRRPRTAAPRLNRDDLRARREAAIARDARERQWQLTVYLSRAPH
jgi:hypothetical protein